MQKDIHPKWYPEAKIICSCGNTFTTGATLEEIRVDICSACHPHFTGSMKYVDTAGRVEKFQKRQAGATNQHLSKKEKKVAKRVQAEKEDALRPKSLKEMLQARK